MKLLERCAASSCVILFCASILSAQDGEALYKRTCAACHDSGAERVPSRETLKAMTPERVLAAMESGAMIAMAARLSVAERRSVAEFVTGKSLGCASVTVPSPQAMCAEAHGASNDLLSGPQWSGWGANLANTRAQDAANAGFTAAEVPRLKLKWAFGFPGDVSASAQPTIAAGHVFVGSQGGKVYALNAATGCVNWWFEAPASVRSAVVIGRIEKESEPSFAAFFGDAGGVVYGVAAGTGKLLWKAKVDSHPAARITGSPTFTVADRMYRSPQVKKVLLPRRTISAVVSGAVWWPWTARPGNKFGKPIRSTKKRIPQRRTRMARNCGALPAAPSGAVRPST
jgi:polyvinyl alcohol dehydrogenase (cytochrome)